MKFIKLLIITAILAGCQSTSSQVNELEFSEPFNSKYPVVNSDLAYKLSLTPQELNEMLNSCDSQFQAAYQSTLKFKENEYYSSNNMKKKYEALADIAERAEPIGRQNSVSEYQYDKLESTFLLKRAVSKPENCRVFSLHLTTMVIRYAPLYYAHKINNIIDEHSQLTVENALLWTLTNKWIVQGGGKIGVRYNKAYDRFTFDLSAQNIDNESKTININGQDISVDFIYQHATEGCTHPERYKVKTKEGMDFIYNYIKLNDIVTFNNFHFYNSKQFFRIKKQLESQFLASKLKSDSAL